MNPPINAPIVDKLGNPIRPFTDFLQYIKSYLLPKGAIILFYDKIPQGFEEVTALTPPVGYKYGRKI